MTTNPSPQGITDREKLREKLEVTLVKTGDLNGSLCCTWQQLDAIVDICLDYSTHQVATALEEVKDKRFEEFISQPETATAITQLKTAVEDAWCVHCGENPYFQPQEPEEKWEYQAGSVESPTRVKVRSEHEQQKSQLQEPKDMEWIRSRAGGALDQEMIRQATRTAGAINQRTQKSQQGENK